MKIRKYHPEHDLYGVLGIDLSWRKGTDVPVGEIKAKYHDTIRALDEENVRRTGHVLGYGEVDINEMVAKAAAQRELVLEAKRQLVEPKGRQMYDGYQNFLLTSGRKPRYQGAQNYLTLVS